MALSRWSLSPAKRIAGASVLSIVAIAATAFAGPIKGHIVGQEKLVPEVYIESTRPDSHRYSWREPSPTVRPEFRALSANPSREICIAALGQNNSPPHDAVLVKIIGGHTTPTTLVVSPGTRVSFENHDPFPHRLYVQGSTTWRAEPIAVGARREWTAPTGGQAKIEFRDELFPSIRSFVVVEPTVVDIAYPGRDGGFGFSLPAGDYVLKAYFAGKQVGKALNVTAPSGTKTLELKDPFNVGEGT